jgi:hypothetical protein
VVTSSRWRRATLTAAGTAIAATYLIGLDSPLRMTTDSVVYLAKAVGIPPPPNSNHYPPGYSVLLRAATHLGLGSASGFVAVNLLLLTVALLAVYRLCRRPLGLTPTGAAVVCLLMLLSHTVSQFTPFVMSDIPDLAATLLCLLALTTAEQRTGRPRLAWLVLAAVLAAAAVSIRFEALALVPPLALVAVGAQRVRRLWRSARRRPAKAIPIAAVSLLALVAVTVLSVGATRYGSEIAQSWGTGGGLEPFLARTGFKFVLRLRTLGELAGQTNCCQRLSTAFGQDVTPEFKGAILIAGVAVTVLVVIGARVRRQFGVIELFLISTAVVLLVYGGLTRYWMASFPFIAVYAYFAVRRLTRFKPVKVVAILYVVAFALAGSAWLVEEVRISTSGRDFPSWEATAVEPMLAATYRIAFGEARPGDELELNPTGLALLRRFEPLARDPHG